MLCSNYFLGTGPSPDPGGIFCGSTLTGTLTNVYSTSTEGSGAIPVNPSLTTINFDTMTKAMAWADGIQVRWQSTDTEVLEIMSSTSKAGSSSSTSTAA